MKTTYQGKEYELLSIDDAVDEFNRQEARGIHKEIVAVEKGCIVKDAVFRKEGEEKEERHDDPEDV